MNKKGLIIGIGIFIVFLIIIMALFNKNSNQKNNTSQINPSEKSLTEQVPANLSDTNLKKIVAKPLNVMPGSPEAPKQEIVKSDKIPSKAIKLKVSNIGFIPKSFTVKAGESVTLAITATDDNMHVFLFPNADLMALSTLVANKETKVITFNAPSVGTYNFRDDIPSNRNNTGVMIVN